MAKESHACIRARMLLGFLPDDELPTEVRKTLALEHIAFNLSEIKTGLERLIMELVARRHEDL